MNSTAWPHQGNSFVTRSGILCFLLRVTLFLICMGVPVGGYADDIRLTAAEVTFIDVGEGDSLLIQSAGESALIDAGNPITGDSVLRLLEAKKIAGLSSLILTHPHPDHYGGIFQLIPRIAIDRFRDNGEELDKRSSSEPMLRWYQQLFRTDRRYRALSRGETIKVGTTSLRVLYPPQKKESADWNTNSLILMMQSGAVKVLLMGDGNNESERILTDLGGDIKANVLKIGHHGASDAGEGEFLDKVGAQATVISVNSNNVNGYPSPDTVAKLQSRSKLYRTDIQGSISLRIFEDGSFEIQGARDAKPTRF